MHDAGADRITAQIAFLREADRLKSVIRATPLADNSRYENSGEHSWHIALYAMVLAEHAGPAVDIARVIRMLLIHDLVEIDAGDAPIYAQVDEAALAEAEALAAERIFGLLPPDQAADFRALWNEFEAAESPDAVFAKAIDRFQPPIQNLASGGGSWTDYNVGPDRIEGRIGARISRGAPALWTWLLPRIRAFFDTRP